MLPRPPSCVIENLSPVLEGGRYAVKRAVGEDILVEADVFKDGHDLLSAVLKWRRQGDAAWHETPMHVLDPYNKDRWRGVFTVFENAVHEFTIEAWGDSFGSWQHEFQIKLAAQQAELKNETLEGEAFISKAAKLARDRGQQRDAERLLALAGEMRESTPAQVQELAHRLELDALMDVYAERAESTEYVLNPPPVPELMEAKAARKKKNKCSARFPLVHVDRPRALFAQWYEFFPRSALGRGDRGSTFRDCLPRIDDARAMGFDVIYFPPVHPVGITARKGRNNSRACQPGEPGVPYAIGNRHQKCPNGGGHKDVAPELGTLEDFDWLVKEIHARDMELALDFALNCSPDHPYVAEHPGWFCQRPDGSIKYAENPPKKYEDVFPLDYHNADWRALWSELASVLEFWCEHGVRTFRVDNPHTKPVAFWEYLIERVQRQWPDAIFLSEAFTRPKMMKTLARAGFTQSYTYFTWRNTKQSLTDYFTELTQSECAQYMRPNLFPNTPDILPSFLQFGGRPAFLIRAVLAATLSPAYGIYSGFELCENAGLEKQPWNAAGDVRQFLHLCDNDYRQLAREEYLDSEKYQWKERDWAAPGNIKDSIARLNRIRRENRALQQLRNLRFCEAENDLVLCYMKATEARDNIVLVVVSLDPFHPQDAFIHVPLDRFGRMESETFEMHDLLHDERYQWSGPRNFVRLTPEKPAHIFRFRRHPP